MGEDRLYPELNQRLEAICYSIRWALDCGESVEGLKSLCELNKQLVLCYEEYKELIGEGQARKKVERCYRRIVRISLLEVAFIHRMRYNPRDPDADLEERWF